MLMNLTDRPTCPHSERLSTAKRECALATYASGERSDEFKGCGCTRFQSERAVASPLSPVSPAAHAIAIVRQSRLAISSSVFHFCRIAIAIAEPIVVERFETGQNSLPLPLSSGDRTGLCQSSPRKKVISAVWAGDFRRLLAKVAGFRGTETFRTKIP
jgi:hypothetical protein